MKLQKINLLVLCYRCSHKHALWIDNNSWLENSIQKDYYWKCRSHLHRWKLWMQPTNYNINNHYKYNYHYNYHNNNNNNNNHYCNNYHKRYCSIKFYPNRHIDCIRKKLDRGCKCLSTFTINCSSKKQGERFQSTDHNLRYQMISTQQQIIFEKQQNYKKFRGIVKQKYWVIRLL